MNPKHDLGHYGSFIVDPVAVSVQNQNKIEAQTRQEVEKLRSYLRKTVIDTLIPRYNVVAEVEKKPRVRVARIRMAITGLEKSAPFKKGGASVEIEVLDSITSEQIVAFIESSSRTAPLQERLISEWRWEDTMAVMDDGAQRLYDRIEEAHGY